MSVVVVAGMRRGGSTLHFNLVCDILASTGRPVSSQWSRELAAGDLAPDGEVFKVVKTHASAPALAARFAAGGIPVAYISRDPRDCLVSYLKKYSKDYSWTEARKFLANIRDEYTFWTAMPAARCSRYETVVADSRAEIRHLAAHLEVVVGDDEVERIAGNRAIESQKARIEAIDWNSKARRIGVDLVDDASLLHSNHISSGEVGQWASRLERLQLAEIDAEFGDWLQLMGYPLGSSPAMRFFSVFRRRLART